MEKIKKFIIIIFIIIICISVLLLILNSSLIKSSSELSNEDEKVDPGELEISENTEVSPLKEVNEYYIINSIVGSYIESIVFSENEILYNTIEPKYISEFNITTENIKEKIGVSYEISETDVYSILIDKIYVSEYHKINTYFVYGKVINQTLSQVYNFNIMVEEQINTDTFYIIPEQFMNQKRYNLIQLGVEYIPEIEEIEENEYNKCDYYNEIEDYTIILDHMMKLTDELTYDFDNSYNLFSDKYKNEKFPTIQEYNQYMNNNMNSLLRATIKKYKIDEYDDYTEYTCIDQYGNYYIFDEKGVMDYTVKLDTYTVETEEFKENYSKYSNEQKAKTNIEKVAQAINRHDYEYLYSKLQNNIRTMNFPTINDFETYMQSNFYSINKFEYGDYDIQGDKGIFELKITDATEENENTIEKNFIITIEDGTDFAFSFNL